MDDARRPESVEGSNYPDSREGEGMKIRPLWGILTAVALIAPAAPAAAGSAATAGAVGSTAHRRHDDAALRAALTAVVDAGATAALALVDDGQKVSTAAVGAARLDPRR